MADETYIEFRAIALDPRRDQTDYAEGERDPSDLPLGHPDADDEIGPTERTAHDAHLALPEVIGDVAARLVVIERRRIRRSPWERVDG